MRLDDVSRAVGYEFHEVRGTWIARSTSEVMAVLQAAEAAAQAGNWVVGFVGYEAAPAFDPAFPARPEPQPQPVAAPAPELPLAWFAAFARRDEVAVVEPPAAGPFLTDVARLHGSEWFRDGVQQVRREIELGGVYQVNLTDRFRCRLAAEPFDLYRSMAATQGGAFNAFVDLGETVVISASPEMFLRVEADTVTTRPMKGTRRRHGRPDADRARADELLASEKDRAENVMIVDLLRNDLSRVSSPGGVSVPDLFRVERYETVWQLTSTVAARLRGGIGLAELFAATFPCGSITGAPKIAAMRTIQRLEPSPRGLYCGAIGMISPAAEGARPASVWSVAIRTAVIDAASGLVEFGSGGGITYDSQPDAEDDELQSKAQVLLAARPAFGLFETILVDQHGAHHLHRHLHRLAASAEHFGFPCTQATLVEIAGLVAALPPVTEAHRLRVTLDRRGRAGVELIAFDPAPATVRLGVAAARVRSDDPFMCHKTTRRAVYDQARAAHPGADDVLLVNERDEVVETTIANLLYRLGDRWYTPPLASGGLPGIGREVLLAAGEVHERVLPLAELPQCDELAVVNALRGRRPAAILVP